MSHAHDLKVRKAHHNIFLFFPFYFLNSNFIHFTKMLMFMWSLLWMTFNRGVIYNDL